jgi:glycosyltransferase involved in cell wall biosynthesis
VTFDTGGRPRTRIVIPCYNEVARLKPDAFLDFAGEHPNISFLFVNDGSTDETARVLRELAMKLPGRLEVQELSRNAGKGEAVRQGMLHALATDAQYVGYWDADLATPLDAILSFVALLDERPGVGMVMGARVQLLGRRSRPETDAPLSRARLRDRRLHDVAAAVLRHAVWREALPGDRRRKRRIQRAVHQSLDF